MSDFSEIDRKIAFGIERIAEIFKMQLTDIGLELGLSQTQVQIIRWLAMEGQMEISKLKDVLGIDITTLSKSLKSLERKGMIKKKKVGRLRFVFLTLKGKKAFEKTQSIHDILLKAIGSLSKSEKEAIYFFIYKVIDEGVRRGLVRYQRMCSTCAYFSLKNDKIPFCLFLQKRLNVLDFMINCKDYIPKKVGLV